MSVLISLRAPLGLPSALVEGAIEAPENGLQEVSEQGSVAG